MDEALALVLRRGIGKASLLDSLLVLPVVPSVCARRAARGSRLAIVPPLVIAGQVSLRLAYLDGAPP